MQRILIILIMLTFGLTGFSQIENEISGDSLAMNEEMITYIETPPKFQGGECKILMKTDTLS